MEILPATGASGRPTIVGHSMGGWVAATAAMRCGEQINSVVVIDSPLRDRAPEAARLRNRRRTEYGSRDEILSHFAAVPRQELVLPYIAEHIAAESVRKAGKRWVWKFDPTIFDGEFLEPRPDDEESLETMIAQMRCRIGYLSCEAGLVSAAMGERLRSVFQLRGLLWSWPKPATIRCSTNRSRLSRRCAPCSNSGRSPRGRCDAARQRLSQIFTCQVPGVHRVRVRGEGHGRSGECCRGSTAARLRQDGRNRGAGSGPVVHPHRLASDPPIA